MSKTKAPNHDYKNPVIYYDSGNWQGNWQNMFGNFSFHFCFCFYLTNETRYSISDIIWRSVVFFNKVFFNNPFQSLENYMENYIAIFQSFQSFQSLEILEILAVQPNHEIFFKQL